MDVKYVISDGHGKYVLRNVLGKFISVNNIEDADVFANLSIAKNVYSSCLGREMKKVFKVVPLCEAIAKEKSGENKSSENSYNKADAESLIGNDYSNELITVLNYFKSVESIVNIDSNELNKRLSDADKSVSDIEHYIEFNKLNARDGYKAFKMLQDTLNERRKVKNLLYVCNVVKEFYSGSKTAGDVISTINNIFEQKYKPRVIKELFEENK